MATATPDLPDPEPDAAATSAEPMPAAEPPAAESPPAVSLETLRAEIAQRLERIAGLEADVRAAAGRLEARLTPLHEQMNGLRNHLNLQNPEIEQARQAAAAQAAEAVVTIAGLRDETEYQWRLRQELAAATERRWQRFRRLTGVPVETWAATIHGIHTRAAEQMAAAARRADEFERRWHPAGDAAPAEPLDIGGEPE